MAGDFNPADHKVAEVNEYLESADADEVARVLEAEAAGDARKGVVEGPHAASEGSNGADETVLVPFAYAHAKNGEVVQLRKGDIVTAGHFKDSSLEHLRSIGFIGSDK